jgi:Ice-binding-like/PEP-CTERM motif
VKLRLVSMLVLVFALPLLALSARADTVSTDFANASAFAVLGATTVTNTGATTLGGNLGVSPGLAITGSGTITLSGSIYTGTPGVAATAQSSALNTYNYLTTLSSVANPNGMNLGGETLTPGVYDFNSSASAQLTGTLTLNFGGAAGNFVFLIPSTLTTASASNVVIENAVAGDNVYWQVGSSATLGTTTSFAGDIIALTAVSLDTGATDGCGSVIALNAAVTMQGNTISTNSCTTTTTETSSGGTVTPVVSGPLTTVAVPEPGTFALLSSGLLAMFFLTFLKSRVSPLI